MFPGNLKKAVTFSYDDGVETDRRLVELFNRYHLKATFNLNSGVQTRANCFEKGGISIHRMNVEGLPELYRGHEIACHTLTHFHPVGWEEETVRNEILQDKLRLEQIFRRPVQGMAYPFGEFDAQVKRIAGECGIRYARTVRDALHFDPQPDLLEWDCACHHNHPRLFELAEAFLQAEPETVQIFAVWGHSYEFEVENTWQRMEELCRLISGRADVFYGTNSEVLLADRP